VAGQSLGALKLSRCPVLLVQGHVINGAHHRHDTAFHGRCDSQCDESISSEYPRIITFQLSDSSDRSYLLPETCSIGLYSLADFCPSIHVSICPPVNLVRSTRLPRVWRGQVRRGAAHFASFQTSISTLWLARPVLRPPEWRQDSGTTASQAKIALF
jgi:hypothetical protein